MIDNFSSYRLSPADANAFWMHFVFALLCYATAQYFASIHFLLMVPYVAYLIFKPRPEHLLPIIIQGVAGYRVAYVIGVFSLIYVILNMEALRSRRLGSIFLIYLSALPFFIWVTFSRFSTLATSVTEWNGSIQGFGYYITLAPFFWGAIVIKRLPEEFYKGFNIFSWVAFIFYVLLYLNFKVPFQRSIMWGCSYIPLRLFYLSVVRPKHASLIEIILLAMGCCFEVLTFVRGGRWALTFSQIGYAIYAIALLYMAKRFKRLAWGLFPLLILITTTFYVWGSAERVERFDFSKISGESYDDMKVDSFAALIKRFQMKSISDRAILWAANVQSVKDVWRNNPVWVPAKPDAAETILFIDGQVRLIKTDLPAHNIVLNTLKNYGFYGGLLFVIVYFAVLSRREIFKLILYENKSQLAMFMALSLGEGIFACYAGGHTVDLTYMTLQWPFCGAVLGIAFEHTTCYSANRQFGV